MSKYVFWWKNVLWSSENTASSLMMQRNLMPNFSALLNHTFFFGGGGNVFADLVPKTGCWIRKCWFYWPSPSETLIYLIIQIKPPPLRGGYRPILFPILCFLFLSVFGVAMASVLQYFWSLGDFKFDILFLISFFCEFGPLPKISGPIRGFLVLGRVTFGPANLSRPPWPNPSYVYLFIYLFIYLFLKIADGTAHWKTKS